MRRSLPALLLAACASMKPPNATEPPDAREGAVTPSDRQLGSRTLPGWPQSSSDRELLDALEQVDGYFLDMGRELRRWSELELGPELPIDEQLAALDLSAHSSEDLFQSKLAFVALLNFPLPRLDEMLAQGARWSREEWAAVRLTRRFALRPSAEAAQARSRASATAEAYVAGYNLWM